ncbi:hypothetical protein O181_078493 [Austropuccinia psidii MF-1]|uniref:Uncharacterized protein n=1 Tax=Austropuccinia psidii MF-1 TaxID=1389203 RepID=A0A9Q3IEP7_9BASI|nr:hypothetical protein [Austropuccinia psidii MF-1]
MVRQENIETASTVTSIIPDSTVNSDHNSTAIVTQNNQPEPSSSESINLDISNTLQKAKNLANSRSGASYNPSSSSQKGHRHDYGRSQSVTEGQGSVDDLQINKLCQSEADKTVLPSKRADTATRSLTGHLQSQPEGLQQCIEAQRVPDPFRSVEKLHELLPDCEKTPGPSQHLQVTQWMASIDGKEEHDSLNSRMEEKQPSTTQASAKKSPSGQQKQFQQEKAATSPEQGQRKGTSHKTLQPGLQDSRDSKGCHGKCISYGQNNDAITKEGCIDASQEEVSRLTMKLNQITADNTRETELWQELTHKEDMYQIEVLNLIQAFQHEYRNSQRCSNSNMNDIEQILNTLPRMSTPLNQNEGTRIPNPQVLDSNN